MYTLLSVSSQAFVIASDWTWVSRGRRRPEITSWFRILVWRTFETWNGSAYTFDQYFFLFFRRTIVCVRCFHIASLAMVSTRSTSLSSIRQNVRIHVAGDQYAQHVPVHRTESPHENPALNEHSRDMLGTATDTRSRPVFSSIAMYRKARCL